MRYQHHALLCRLCVSLNLQTDCTSIVQLTGVMSNELNYRVNVFCLMSCYCVCHFNLNACISINKYLASCNRSHVTFALCNTSEWHYLWSIHCGDVNPAKAIDVPYYFVTETRTALSTDPMTSWAVAGCTMTSLSRSVMTFTA